MSNNSLIFNKDGDIYKFGELLKTIGGASGKTGDLIDGAKRLDDMAEAVRGLNIQEALLALTTKHVSKEDQKLILVKAGLVAETEAETIVTNGATVAKSGNLTVTELLSAAYTKLAARIGISTTALTAFIGGAALLIGAVVVIEKLHKSTKELQEELEKSRNSLSNVASEVESLNSELETTRNRIKELNDIDNISLTEEQELEQLKLKNQELERELRLKQEIEAQNQKEVNDKARKYFGKGTSNNAYSQFDSINNFEKDIEVAQAMKDSLEDAKQEYYDLLNKSNRIELTGEEYDRVVDLEHYIKNVEQSYERYAEELSSTYSDFAENDDNITDSELLNDLNKAYDAYDKLLDKAGWTERKLSEILSTRVSADNRSEIFSLAKDGALSTELIESEYTDIVKELEKLGISTEDFYQYIISESGSAANAVSDIGEAFEFVNKTISQNISDLNDLKGNLGNIATAFKTFKETEEYDIGDLDSIADYFLELEDVDEEIMSTVNDALNILASPTATLEEQENAIDSLADAYLRTSEVLKSLSMSNKELMISELKKMGIVNAEEIVIQQLNNRYGDLELQEQFLKEEKKEVADATADEVLAFLSEVQASEKAIMAVAQFTLEKEKCNGIKIDTSQDIANIISLARAAEVSAAQIAQLTSAQSILNAAEHDSGLMNSERYKEAQKIMESLANGTYKFDYKSTEYDPYADYLPNTDFEFDGSIFDDANSSAKDTAETFDWIETLISRIQRNITNLGKLVSATYRNWSTRNNALAQEMAEVNKEINAQMTAYNAYMAKANSIPLAEGYKALVRSGAYRIEDIADEGLREQISAYKEWYEKALDASDAIEDLRANLADLAMTKFDNVSKQYDDQITMIEHHVSMLEGFVSQSEAAGYMASEAYYKAMAEKQEMNIAMLQSEYSSLLSAFDEAVKSGSIEKYSEDWYEMYNNIGEVEQSLQDATTQLIEFNQTLQQLSWEVFDRVQDSVNNIVSEAEFLIDVLDGYDLHTDKGAITDEGLAAQGLHAVNYNTYMEQALAYAEEMRKIEAEIANDPYDMELVDRRNELLKLQQDAISNAMSEKEAIHSLISEGYNKMLESLNELIDKRKEALQAEKDLYDYQNSISEKTSNISSLQKQLQAYAGDNSEGAKATIQKLQVSLAEAEKDLQETEYERYLSDQEQMLDTLYDQTEQWVNERLDNLDGLIAEAIEATNANAETISNTIHEAANAYGYKLSDQMETIWDYEENAIDGVVTIVSIYGDILHGVGEDLLTSNTNIANAITGGTTNVINTINGLNVSMQTMINSLNEIANTNKNSIAQAQNAVASGQNNSYPTNNSASNVTISGGNTGGTGNSKPLKGYSVTVGGKTIGGLHATKPGAQAAAERYIAEKAEEEALKAAKNGGANATYLYNVTKAGVGSSLSQQIKIKEEYASGTPHAKSGWSWVGEGKDGSEIILDKEGNALLTLAPQLYNFKGGEQVINGKDTADILNGNNLIPLNTEQLWSNIIKTPKLPDMVNKDMNNSINNDVHLNIAVKANNFDEFCTSFRTAIKDDPQCRKLLRAVTIDETVGKGGLRRNNF